MWTGLFENKPITKQSIIINPVILNPYSNQHESGWAIYPNIYSVIGFLTYVYLPTAFIGVVNSDGSSDRYYTEDDLDDLLESYKTEKNIDVNLVDRLIGKYEEVIQLNKGNDEDAVNSLKNWVDEFNKGEWFKKDYTGYTFNIFKTPLEAAQYIIKIYEEEENLGLDTLEDQIGISRKEFIRLSGDEIYSNEFMRRKFADILTNRLKVAF
ncbi:MAG: hypothetical protein LRY73_07640 [Bacillus sp. (in: Bacteria)]|nr:hypothetical protein [Bacillus sp. (in: firmicutes)]